MPALVPVARALRIGLKYQEQEDTDILNIFHMQYSGTPAISDFPTFATHVGTVWASNMASVSRNEISLVSVRVTDLTSSVSPEVEESTVHPGTAGTGTQGSGVAMVLKREIARRYRGGHSRLYLPGTRSSELTDSQLWAPARAAAWLAAWVGFMNDVITGAPAGFGALVDVNISYFHGFTNFTFPSGRVRAIPTPRVAPIVDLVTGYDINARPASQRRRNLQGS